MKKNNIFILSDGDEDGEQFYTLVTLLMATNPSKNDNIAEISFLEYFNDTSKFPSECFTSKDIITNMKNKYEAYQLLNTPETRAKINFSYCGKPLTFGYHLSFSFDVFLICCLHFITCHETSTKSIKIITDIMRRKYDLKQEYDTSIQDDSQALTMHRISLCFPSIMMTIKKLKKPKFMDQLFTLVPGLPATLVHPHIIYIIPNLNRIPIALLMYVMIIVREYHARCEPSNVLMYYDIVKYAYLDNIFPEKLKISLCLRWGILKIEEGKYVFDKKVIACSKIAKHLIRELKPNDPTLEQIFHMLY